MLSARRWTTPITREQFRRTTGLDGFPDYLRGAVQDGVLHVSSNGEFNYRLRGVHCRVAVTWKFEAPAGAGDMHRSLMRGTRATLLIRQGAAEDYHPTLFVLKPDATAAAEFEAALAAAVAALQPKYPGVGFRREGEEWRITVPAGYDVGPEAHFAQVMQNFLDYLRAGRLPAWEVPNMITKYATIMQAYELSR
jgi:hypothetical protein